MVVLEMNHTEFIDMIKKMAIPTKSREELFLFPTIALNIRSNNEIEWIGRFRDVVVWVRANCAIHTNVEEPAQIPVNALALLDRLKRFKKEDMTIKKKDVIKFTHDSDQGVDTLINIYSEERKFKTVLGPVANLSEVRGMLESLPFRLDKEGSDIVLFQNGLVKPNISGSCDAEVFQEIVKLTKQYKRNRAKDTKDRALKKKEMAMPSIYNIYIEENEIKTILGGARSKYWISDSKTLYNVHGQGELHYSLGFAEVVNVLSGQIKFYAINNGPLWIMQDTDLMKLRYLIAPTPVYTF